MRVEIDLPNPDGLLREGMYGERASGSKPPRSDSRCPWPASSTAPGRGRGWSRSSATGRSERVKVELGADNGTLVEVDSGLGPDDEVVLRSSTPLEEGMAVEAIKASRMSRLTRPSCIDVTPLVENTLTGRACP